MKRYLLLSIFAIVLAAVGVAWRASRSTAPGAAGPSSQIYIHGTPVCVLKEGDGIVARVGKCETDADQGGEAAAPTPFQGSPGASLPPGHPRLLPPGHPPVPPDMGPDMRQDGANQVAI